MLREHQYPLMNVFGYGRVSTDHQALSLIAQREKAESAFKFFQSIGRLPATARWVSFFEDEDVSGKTPWFQRPMGSTLFTLAQRGDMIIVANYDRAIRSVRDVCDVVEQLNEKGVLLVILDADFDTSTIMGRAFMKFIALLKEIDREEIVRRTREAKKFALENGLPTGGRAPWGWKIARRMSGGDRVRPYYVIDQGKRRLSEKVVRMIDDLDMSQRQVEAALAKEGYTNPSTKRPWTQRHVGKMYDACKDGFPLPGGIRMPGRIEKAGVVFKDHNPDLD